MEVHDYGLTTISFFQDVGRLILFASQKIIYNLHLLLLSLFNLINLFQFTLCSQNTSRKFSKTRVLLMTSKLYSTVISCLPGHMYVCDLIITDEKLILILYFFDHCSIFSCFRRYLLCMLTTEKLLLLLNQSQQFFGTFET